jgi:hypothetical protein
MIGRVLFGLLLISIALSIGAMLDLTATQLGLPTSKRHWLYSCSGVFTAMYFPRTRLGKAIKQRMYR